MAARIRIAALLLVLGSACHDTQRAVPPPLDSFYFPTGLAVRHMPEGCTPGAAGCRTQLLVASSNFDLQYDAVTGGTMLAVDPDVAMGGNPGASAGPLLPGAVLGAVRVGTFAGEVAVVDETTCPGWETGRNPQPPQVLVASRAQNVLYRLNVDPASGALSCGPACVVPLAAGLADTYGVTVACGALAPAQGGVPSARHLAFVTYLRTPLSEGYLSRIDLDSGVLETTYDLGPQPTQTSVFDPARNLLFVSSLFEAVGISRLRWLDLEAPQLGFGAVDFGTLVRGAELVTLALSTDSPPSRAYVAARLYDPDSALASGLRPTVDLGGALLVVDLQKALAGAPPAEVLLRIVRVDRGPAVVAVTPRLDASGNRIGDLVAVTSSDDGTMTLYDSAVGATAAVFTICGSGAVTAAGTKTPSVDDGAPQPCYLGNPSLGRQPFGLAWERYQPAGQPRPLARLFVGSFDRDWVNAMVFDPSLPDVPISWGRIGPERIP